MSESYVGGGVRPPPIVDEWKLMLLLEVR
jgi:hypothetical protein